MNTIVRRIPSDHLTGIFAGYCIECEHCAPNNDVFWKATNTKTGTILTRGYYLTALGAARCILRAHFHDANPNYDGTH